ncbi:MAG: NAD-binding protein [Haloferacaceae archaeon]
MPQRAIIVGGGPIGSRVAAILGDYGYDPVVIEQDADRCEQLHSSHRGVIINGDATRPEIVDQAEPERADIFAALTGSPERNHTICRRVKRQAGPIRTVAERTPSGDATESTSAADETVRVSVAGAKAVANAMLGYDQQVCSVPTSGFDLVRLSVDPRAPAANRELSDVALPSGSTVVADIETMEIAGPDTELRPDRQYFLAVEPAAAGTVRNLLQGGL